MTSQHLPLRQDEADHEVTVVHFNGGNVSLDEETIERLRAPLFALAEEPGRSPLLLDFRNVDYVTSLTLGTLVTLHKKLLASGRRLTIQNLTPPVFEIFAVTKLDEYLDLRRAEQQAEAKVDGRCGSSAGILVVDDEPAVLAVVEAGLRNEGYKVWLASHGQQGIELYRRYRDEIGVVLLDVHMPGIDGPHTLLALQDVAPALRCCFMSGNIDPYSEEGLLQMGAVRVFPKPFSLIEVLDTLNRLLSQSSPRRRDRWIELPSSPVAEGHP
jgi:anti-anti-sigma factor